MPYVAVKMATMPIISLIYTDSHIHVRTIMQTFTFEECASLSPSLLKNSGYFVQRLEN